MALSTDLAVCQQRRAGPRDRACADVVGRADGDQHAGPSPRPPGQPQVGLRAPLEGLRLPRPLSAGVRVPRLRWTPAGPSRAVAQGCDRHRSRSGRSGSCVTSRMGACALPKPGEDIAKLPATINPNWSDDIASPLKTPTSQRSGSRIGCKRRTPGVQGRRRRDHNSGSTASGLSSWPDLTADHHLARFGSTVSAPLFICDRLCVYQGLGWELRQNTRYQ
eukprot:1196387-Prorocentrum_minimum.AAC.2